MYSLAPLRSCGDQQLQNLGSASRDISNGGRFTDDSDSGKWRSKAVVYLGSERHFREPVEAMTAQSWLSEQLKRLMMIMGKITGSIYGACTILSAFHVFIHLVLTTTLLGIYYYHSPITDEKLTFAKLVMWQTAFPKDGCHTS